MLRDAKGDFDLILPYLFTILTFSSSASGDNMVGVQALYCPSVVHTIVIKTLCLYVPMLFMHVLVENYVKLLYHFDNLIKPLCLFLPLHFILPFYDCSEYFSQIQNRFNSFSGCCDPCSWSMFTAILIFVRCRPTSWSFLDLFINVVCFCRGLQGTPRDKPDWPDSGLHWPSVQLFLQADLAETGLC